MLQHGGATIVWSELIMPMAMAELSMLTFESQFCKIAAQLWRDISQLWLKYGMA